MAVVNFEARVSSRFDCPNPLSAAPAHKRMHVLPAVYDVKRPHCAVELVMGTRGAWVDRTDTNFYTGHVPDAPVLLSADASRTYAAATSACGWSGKRIGAFVAAAAVGSVAAVLFTAVVTGVIFGLSVAAPAHFAAVTLGQFVFLSCWCGAVGAGVLLMVEWADWARARGAFATMLELSTLAERMLNNVTRPGDETLCNRLVGDTRGSDDWLVQQAGLELDGLREAHGAFGGRKAG